MLFVLLASFQASAKWSTTTEAKVTNVTSHVDRHIIQTSISDANCGGKFYWLIDSSNPSSKDMLSIALVALTTQLNVYIVFDETVTTCHWAGDEATHISITK